MRYNRASDQPEASPRSMRFWTRRPRWSVQSRRRQFLPRIDLMEDRTLLSACTVLNLNDSGPCSLRAEITAANQTPGANTIDFANRLHGTIILTSGELLVTNSVTGLQTLTLVTPPELPASYTSTLMIDSIRAVQVTYKVSNGDTGSAQRIQSFSLTSALPNLAAPELQTCGNSPQPVPSVTATASGSTGNDSVTVTWPPSPDEWGGERDIMRYIVWRRLATDSTWNNPFTSVPNGEVSYTIVDLTAPDGVGVEYAVSAQDCTPAFSNPVNSSMVTPP